MELPCRVRVNYRGYAVAVHRRLCYPHVTSAAVVYGGRGYWTNGRRICLTRARKTLRLLPGETHHSLELKVRNDAQTPVLSFKYVALPSTILNNHLPNRLMHSFQHAKRHLLPGVVYHSPRQRNPPPSPLRWLRHPSAVRRPSFWHLGTVGAWVPVRSITFTLWTQLLRPRLLQQNIAEVCSQPCHLSEGLRLVYLM